MTFSPKAIEAAARAVIKTRQEWADREGPFGVYYLSHCGVGQHAVRDFRPGAEAKIVARFDTHEEAMAECALLTEQHFLTAALAVDGVALQGWQDISTAPKDGTPVDLWCANSEFPNRVTDAQWRKPTESEWFVHGGDGMKTADAQWLDPLGWPMTGDDAPTHWQPLPPPPAASDREERR